MDSTEDVSEWQDVECHDDRDGEMLLFLFSDCGDGSCTKGGD